MSDRSAVNVQVIDPETGLWVDVEARDPETGLPVLVTHQAVNPRA